MMGNNGGQHGTATFVVIILKYATTLILPSSTGPCRLKKYAVPSVFKLQFKPKSIPKEARSRLEMPEGSSTHQGHKRPMSREHLL